MKTVMGADMETVVELTADTAFKFVCENTVIDDEGREEKRLSGVYADKFIYPPVGEWCPDAVGQLVMCRNGYHTTTITGLLRWATGDKGEALYVAETDGDCRYDSRECKWVNRRMRLVRKVDTWNARSFFLCVMRVAGEVLQSDYFVSVYSAGTVSGVREYHSVLSAMILPIDVCDCLSYDDSRKIDRQLHREHARIRALIEYSPAILTCMHYAASDYLDYCFGSRSRRLILLNVMQTLCQSDETIVALGRERINAIILDILNGR